MTRVLVLGGPDGLTRAVAQRLGESDGIESCQVVDVRERPVPDIESDAFDVAVYLAAAAGHRGWPPGPQQLEATLRSVAAQGVEALVVVSSASIFPPRHQHPGMVEETKPALRAANAASDAWSAVEQAAKRVLELHPSVVLTTLRPAPVPTPDGDDYFSRVLRGRAAATFVGHDPQLQLLSVDDLGRALARVVRARPGGLFHVTPAGGVPTRKALGLAGTRRLPLPAWLHRVGRWALRGVRVAPWADAERLRYPSTVSGRKLEETLDFHPQMSSAEVAASFAGRRLQAGALPDFDPYGQDKQYIARLHRTIMGFLYNVWWRVEVEGTDNVPRQGAAVLTGVHRGFMPFDGTMLLYHLVSRLGRYPRFLIHPNLAKEVFLADFIRKQGGLLACRPNADWVLQQGELLGYFPEGVEGAFSYYWDAYRLRADFGRYEFVRTALRNSAPIVPFVTVGSAEMFPVLAKFDWGWWKRLTGWPCFPIAPPFPLLPVPFPTKWHTQILEPLRINEEYGSDAADDDAIVVKIGDEVRARMQAAIDAMRRRRRFIFFGSIFAREGRSG